MEVGITDIVFDYCGVLLDWQPRLALDGLYPPGVVDMFFDRSDPWGFDYYDAMMDAGWSEERVLDDYGRHHGPAVAWVFRLYLQRQQMALNGMIPGMEALLHDLDRAGIRLWGLTNFTTKSVNAAHTIFPALSLLRNVVVSSEERLRKPDPHLYRRAVERFGVDARTTAFVDDRQSNVEAAEAEGMRGARFQDAERLRAELKALNVPVDINA